MKLRPICGKYLLFELSNVFGFLSVKFIDFDGYWSVIDITELTNAYEFGE